MMSLIQRFRSDEEGQGLVEYTLLIAFIIFTIVGLSAGYRKSISGVTGVTNSNLAAANNVVAGSS